jgi:hypothetical protein
MSGSMTGLRHPTRLEDQAAGTSASGNESEVQRFFASFFQKRRPSLLAA